MKILRIILTVALLMTFITGCQKMSSTQQDGGDGGEKYPLNEPKDNPGNDYFEFVRIRKDKPTDFHALDSLYKKKLSKIVKASDKMNKTSFDSKIQDALNDALAGKDLFANAQIAEKTIQHAFVKNFKRALDDLLRSRNKKQSKLDISAATKIFVSVAERRGKWIDKGNEYKEAITEMMQLFELSIEQKNMEKAKEIKSQLDNIVNKILFLSVLYELDGLSLARGKNQDTAAEKRIEALIYHQMILDEHQKRNPEGAAMVVQQLARPADEIEIQLVRNLLKTAFSKELVGIDEKKLGL